MLRIFSVSFLIVVLYAVLGLADPAIDMLVTKSKGDQDPVGTGLQSGRYQVREVDPDDVNAPVVAKTPAKSKKRVSKKPASVTAEANLKSAEPTEPAMKQEPTVSDQVKDLMQGSANHIVELYREQIHPDDVRNNRIELELHTGLMYDGSSSTNAYRTYYSYSPYYNFAARMWMTPSFGFSASYQATRGESLPSASSGASLQSVNSQWQEFRMNFRKFYGMSRRANSLGWGVVYNQYLLSVSQSSSTRVGLRSDSYGLYLETRIPTAPSYAWIFGGEFFPVDNATELSGALSYQSGGSATSSRSGLHMGGEVKMSRQNQILWNVGVNLENSQFTGSSSLTDPITGLTPSGVSVTNTWTYFNLGYRWGQ